LEKGDFLVCDNATVHHGDDSLDLIDATLAYYGM
jgi:hypothetical protein